jgi:hypothetical protein
MASRHRALPWGVKAVFLRLLDLDRGPEGAFISDASLGESLGLDAGTVKNYRFHLRSLGLAVTFPREGARQFGWVMQLPAIACPGSLEKDAEVRGKRAGALAKALDDWLDSNPEIAAEAMPRLPQEQSRDCRSAEAQSASSAPERGVGVRGPPSEVQSKAQLPPAVTQTEDGVGAKAPGKRMEKVAGANIEPREEFETKRAKLRSGFRSMKESA